MTKRHVIKGETPPSYTTPEEVRRIALLILEDYKKSREEPRSLRNPPRSVGGRHE